MKRNHIYNIKSIVKNKKYLNLLNILLKNNLFKNKSILDTKKITKKIVVNKSPHVNSKAKKKYEKNFYIFFNKNQNKVFSILLKKFLGSSIAFIIYKKIV